MTKLTDTEYALAMLDETQRQEVVDAALTICAEYERDQGADYTRINANIERLHHVLRTAMGDKAFNQALEVRYKPSAQTPER